VGNFRPEDGYNVSRNMSQMEYVLVNIRRVVFDSIYLLNFEITQRYGQYKYKEYVHAYEDGTDTVVRNFGI
jgi:hypothetical protein